MHRAEPARLPSRRHPSIPGPADRLRLLLPRAGRSCSLARHAAPVTTGAGSRRSLPRGERGPTNGTEPHERDRAPGSTELSGLSPTNRAPGSTELSQLSGLSPTNRAPGGTELSGLSGLSAPRTEPRAARSSRSSRGSQPHEPSPGSALQLRAARSGCSAGTACQAGGPSKAGESVFLRKRPAPSPRGGNGPRIDHGPLPQPWLVFLKLIRLPGWGQGAPSVSPRMDPPAHLWVAPPRAGTPCTSALPPPPPAAALLSSDGSLATKIPPPAAQEGEGAPSSPQQQRSAAPRLCSLLRAEPCTGCSITLTTQLIIISFAINLLVKRNSTHLLLINGALKPGGGWAGGALVRGSGRIKHQQRQEQLGGELFIGQKEGQNKKIRTKGQKKN
ncbi:basic salivary proline-rich protein 2-like [Motacilla alba alba]|uniref:basic salivary proline-rich protein 2-like n=1 Tax=Motacilla alba alba TaxID=1094192 RepID=UPI0018D4F400|nr:basic salivary proline-rich protein 2-like [Motacilla alba alba]